MSLHPFRAAAAPPLLHSLPWGVDDTAVALVRAGVPKDDARLLQSQDVDGESLALLSDDSLARMGVQTFGRRAKIMRAVQSILDTEAERRGLIAPNVLGVGAGGPMSPSSGAFSPSRTAVDVAARDPYATLPRGASPSDPFLRTTPVASPSAALYASSSQPFQSTQADRFNDDTNLLDPAALTPAASVTAALGRTAPMSLGFDRPAASPKSFGGPSASPVSFGASSSPAATTPQPFRTRDYGVASARDAPTDRKVSQSVRDENAHSFARTIEKSALARSNLFALDRSDVDRDRDAEEQLADQDAENGYDSDIDRHFHHPRLDSQVAAYDPRIPSADANPFLPHDPSVRARGWLGAIVAPSRMPRTTTEPPARRLQLEWVHGYRAFDSRSNLVYNSNGDIVYPVAGLCVVYTPRLRRQKFFFGHDDDVRCLAQHPTVRNLIASGQSGGLKDGVPVPPRICVWDSSSSDLSRSYALQCTAADKSIRSVAFSGGDGRYLASISSDESYSLKMWDWKKRLLLTAAKSDTKPIFMVRGNPKDEAEFVTVGKNHVLFWTFDGHVLKNRRGVIGGGLGGGAAELPSFYAITFSEKGYACLGCENGGIYIFVGGKAAKVFSGVHRGKILSLEWYNGGFVSGGSDGAVHVLDKKMDVTKSFTFSNKVTSVAIGGPHGNDTLLVGTQGSDVFEVPDFFDQTIEGDERLDAVTRGHSDGELWALAVAGDGKHFVTAGEDNTICLFNLESHRLLKRGILSDRKGHILSTRRQISTTTSTHPVNQCARAIAISPSGNEILVGTAEGELVVFDTRTFARKLSVPLTSYKKALRNAVDGTPTAAARGGATARTHFISTIQFSPSGHAVAVGTHGAVVVLLDVTAGYAVRAVLDRAQGPITALDWSADGTLIQTNDTSFDLLHYHVDEQNLKSVAPITNASSVRDVAWHTHTCTLSWPTSGITQPHHQGQFVNTTDASPSRTLIATGDDSGHVNLFNFPALPGAQPLVYAAHSAHVTSARFTPDERYLLTTGGHDLAVCQWAVL